jgi:hypothetical protein
MEMDVGDRLEDLKQAKFDGHPRYPTELIADIADALGEGVHRGAGHLTYLTKPVTRETAVLYKIRPLIVIDAEGHGELLPRYGVPKVSKPGSGTFGTSQIQNFGEPRGGQKVGLARRNRTKSDQADQPKL